MDPLTASLIVSGINTAVGVLLGRRNGMKKELATKLVNDAEIELKRLIATWEQLNPKSEQSKNEFLNAVLKIFDQTKYFLTDPQLGDYGKRAIMERFGTYDPRTGKGERGTGGNGWENWWVYYWDPIAMYGLEGKVSGSGSNSGNGYTVVNGSSQSVNQTGLNNNGYVVSMNANDRKPQVQKRPTMFGKDDDVIVEFKNEPSYAIPIAIGAGVLLLIMMRRK